ncbi:MAG: GTP cyclohydrolase I FolE2 [Nitrososphaerota archaeon]|nr:GTP cyclohydrolase I FolE2 [Nitrososphaerota archaeon]MDG6922420.1 GTP cyclohydrolase I FolE2 [Nitrososphaerota archaeon]
MTEVRTIHNDQPTQDRLPKVKETIDRVGISGLRTGLKLTTSSGETYFTAEIDLFIDLDTERKGIHMSRLVESINEVISKGSREPKDSFETLGVDILSELRNRHKYSTGGIAIKTTMFLRRHTPVTNKPTDEPYDVTVGVISRDNRFFKNLRVKAVGNTLCPHSLETTKGKAHVQRAEVDLQIEVPIDEEIRLEELIEICEKSFSSPTFTVLKTSDEASVVEEMFRNPKFVEDVARDCFRMAKNLNFKGKVKIRATSFESIHKHNAISEIERSFN